MMISQLYKSVLNYGYLGIVDSTYSKSFGDVVDLAIDCRNRGKYRR